MCVLRSLSLFLAVLALVGAKLPRTSTVATSHENHIDRDQPGRQSVFVRLDRNRSRSVEVEATTAVHHLHERTSTFSYSATEQPPERKFNKKQDKKWFKQRSHKAWSIINEKFASREKRSVVNSGKVLRSTGWSHTEWFGDGQVALQWKTKVDEIVFRVEAKDEGHVGLSIDNDAVLVWFDNNEEAVILDCHLINGVPVADASNDYQLLFALKNYTHIVAEFKRKLDTCDSQDAPINSDAVNVRWTLGKGNPMATGWKGWKGSRKLRLLNPKATAPGSSHSTEYKRWDVVFKNLEVPEFVPTMFWVKIFRVPPLAQKHHIVGYRPVGKFGTAGHAVLYECAIEAGADNGQWDHWAMMNATNILNMPREWSQCLSPVATCAVGSKGEMFPEHVGIPLAGPDAVTYYMLEVHYENLLLQNVVDDFGLTIYYTDELRPHDAGVMVSGITISALHVLPANQPMYRSAGYCAEPCTNAMFPPDGINVVSVLLHAHSAKRRLALRHIRNGEELPKIAEDEYNEQNKNTQSRVLLEERNVLPGDSLITECTYNTQGRLRPTLGGYSSKQEMCLAFILHYPRIPLAGCYSMTPVKEFFETFGVKEFYSIEMKDVENMFLASGSLEMMNSGTPDFASKSTDLSETTVQGDDQGVSVLSQLLIKEPFEFRNKTFIAHLNEIPWNEPLLTKRIEDTLYKGKHMTFCRKRDDTLAVPVEIRLFPNFSEVIPSGSTLECLHKLHQKNSTSSSTTVNQQFNILPIVLLTLIIYVSSN